MLFLLFSIVLLISLYVVVKYGCLLVYNVCQGIGSLFHVKDDTPVIIVIEGEHNTLVTSKRSIEAIEQLSFIS